MTIYRKKSDWGCLPWFLLAFVILGLIIVLISLAASPSGGSGGPCGSLSNPGEARRTDSTTAVKWAGHTSGVMQVSSSGTSTGGAGGKGSSGSRPGPAPKPVSPVKPAPVKPPQGGSTGKPKSPKIKIDVDDCD